MRSGSREYTASENATAAATKNIGSHLRIGPPSRLGPVEEMFDDFVEHRRVELVANVLSVALRKDEVAVAEDTEVPRHRGPRGREAIRDLARGTRPGTQQLQYLAPRRVGERAEDIVHWGGSRRIGIQIISQVSN